MNRDQDREETAEEQARREGAAHERARVLGPNATAADASELATALQAYHQGSEREELRRLLVRLWGPSPSLHEQATAQLKAINDADQLFERLEAKVSAIIQQGASELRGTERALRPGDLIAPDDEIRVKFEGPERPTTVMVHLDIEPREP